MIQIGKRRIGEAEPCFIIAEAGSNHNGSLDQARRLIDIASEAGADAVKFQLFRADRMYPKNAGISGYLKSPKTIYDIISEMEMPYEWLPRLQAHCQERKILFFASVFDEESADRLDPYVEAFKIASYELTHHPLVRHVALKGKSMILSTGTANLDEVKETIREIEKTGNENFSLMQCTAAYPAPLESLNLRVIPALKEIFGVPVGLSDHSRDPVVAPLAAVGIGANLLEKHFTLSNRLPGPDHPFALEPPELKQMIREIRQAEKAMGNGQKVMQPVETELRSFARRSIFSVREIQAGETFSRENIAVLRRGVRTPGLEPKDFPRLLGKRALRRILLESSIQWEDILS